MRDLMCHVLSAGWLSAALAEGDYRVCQNESHAKVFLTATDDDAAFVDHGQHVGRGRLTAIGHRQDAFISQRLASNRATSFYISHALDEVQYDFMLPLTRIVRSREIDDLREIVREPPLLEL